jgi:hypothetical protein
MKITAKSIMSVACLAILASLSAPPARAQQDDDVIHQTVARVSFVEGDASYSRGDDPDEWQPAAINVPMSNGDRIYTADGSRAELQLQGAWVRLSPGSDLTALNLTQDVKQFSLTGGTASFRVRRLRADDVFEVDTPNAAVTFEAAGDYRIDIDAEGNSRVAVRRGQSTIAAEGGQIPLSAGSAITIQGLDNPYYDVVDLTAPDAWDRWVSFRDARSSRMRSAPYVSADIVGTEDLDQYGRWSAIPNYGEVWSPATVSADWAPYRDGQWMWQDPWGWTWVGAEPWGWAPYHYGRWVTYSSRWYWVPDGRRSAVTYSPALVAFVGGGPGWSASVAIGGGGGYVGWFPLAPRDPFVPWWGPRRSQANVTNVTYVNQTYVTVVNQNTFVSGTRIANNYVRDPQIVRQVVSAPTVRGTIPIMPTAASIRVTAAGARPAPRPPAAVVNRAVVTRIAPPAAPAPFQAKMRVIQENRGAPVAPSVAARISVESHGGARAAVPVRPAAVNTGQTGLTARRGAASIQPQAVTAPRGKALATAQRPLVATPGAAAVPNSAPPARVAPGAVVAPDRSRGGPPQRPAVVPPAAPSNVPPPSTNASPESWRQRVPPGQEKKNPEAQQTPPAREIPPERRAAPPPPQATVPPPASRGNEQPDRRPNFAPAPPKADEQAPPANPRGRAVPPPRESSPETAPPPPARREMAPPPGRAQQPTAPPPDRESPPPPRRQVTPPPERPAPPPRPDGSAAPTRSGPPSRTEQASPGNSGRPPAREKTAEEKNQDKKNQDKKNKDKKEEPPPPPPSR